VKDVIEWIGGKRYKFCLDNGDVAWYSDNTLEFNRRINYKLAKILMLEIESVDGLGVYLVGKYGILGLFVKLE
jgi:hypothetical protein